MTEQDFKIASARIQTELQKQEQMQLEIRAEILKLRASTAAISLALKSKELPQ